MDQDQNRAKKVAYICEGSCQAKITEEEYDNGLKTCGTKECTDYGEPFKKLEGEQIAR